MFFKRFNVNNLLVFLLLLTVSTAFGADDESDAQTGLRFRIVPLVTSTPLAGTGVDLRLDLVTTSENEYSLYLALNQAF